MLGLFGIVAGIEAVYYAHAGRLSGDDYTGFAAMPAGLALNLVAAVTLWRTRRVDDHPAWRWGRRVLLSGVTVLVMYLLVAPFLLTYLLTHTARAFVPVDRVGAPHENVFQTCPLFADLLVGEATGDDQPRQPDAGQQPKEPAYGSARSRYSGVTPRTSSGVAHWP